MSYLSAILSIVFISRGFSLTKISINRFSNKKLRSDLFLSDDQREIPLLSAINAVTPAIKDRYFFPGHCGGEYAPKSLKRLYGQDLFQYDLPELDGLDNIHYPEGPLLRALQLASELFGAKQTWFLVNGSTSGILSAILACVQMHQHRQLSFHLKESNLDDDDSVDATSANHAVALNNDVSILTEPRRSVMLLGRDSHKASFDGLRLADCDGALLPCLHDDNFGIPLGVDLTYISEALDTYGSQV
jgi:arginine/lysine/ornithine decarboxylase